MIGKNCQDVHDDEQVDLVNENLKIIQKKRGLKFGTDSYLLAAFVRKKRNVRIVELGGGTGIVSFLCLTKGKADHATIVEIQPDYCDLICRNAEMNGLQDRVHVIQSDIRDTNACRIPTAPSVVIANPPYMLPESGFHNTDIGMDIARRDIHGGIRDFAARASDLLHTGGIFDIVFRPDRMTDLICALRTHRLEPKKMVCVYPHESASPSLVLVEARKDASPGLMISRPLFVYRAESEKDYTVEMQQIYVTCSMEFLFR